MTDPCATAAELTAAVDPGAVSAVEVAEAAIEGV
jgi:hypothetical protein